MVSSFLSFQPCYNKKENGEKVCVSSEKIVNFALVFKLSGCSAVGSALRSGRRGRQFDSGHPDRKREEAVWFLPFLVLLGKLALLA